MARTEKSQTRVRMEADAVTPSRTRTNGDPASYMARLTRQRLLTVDEEVSLATRVRQGDALAKDHLIEANMRLVINIAKSYHTPMIPFEDLVQEGAIGLMTACERFDPSKGYRFSTYATHWIRQAISRAIDNKSRAIRVPAHVSETLRKLERARSEHVRATGEEPSIEYLARVVQMPIYKVAAYLQATQDPVSLDMLVGEEENTSLASLLDDKSAASPEETLIRREVEAELRVILDTLNEREQMVMRRRLGFDGEDAQVLQDIGQDLHISRERVRQIEAQALNHLRAAAHRRRLRDYLAE